jgi:hypothetical protein
MIHPHYVTGLLWAAALALVLYGWATLLLLAMPQ